MKSKAALFLEEAGHNPKDYMPKAMQWWSKLAPKQQKEWLSKLPPDKVAMVYKDLFGAIPKDTAHEDMSKIKKVLAAAVLAAFMTAGAAGASHAIDYKVVGQDSKGNPIYAVAGSGGSHASSNQSTGSSTGGNTGSGGGGNTVDKAADTVSKAASLLNLGAQAAGQFGTQHSQQRAYKTSSDVNFIAGALKVLTGN